MLQLVSEALFRAACEKVDAWKKERNYQTHTQTGREEKMGEDRVCACCDMAAGLPANDGLGKIHCVECFCEVHDTIASNINDSH